MTQEEKKFWEDQFNKLKVDWKDVMGTMEKWIEKFGKLGAQTKNELSRANQAIDRIVNKPFYKKGGFYFDISKWIILFVLLILILLKGGHIKIPGVFDFGLEVSTETTETFRSSGLESEID